MWSKPFLGHAAYYHNCSNYTNSFVPDMRRHIKYISYTTIFSLWRQSLLFPGRNIIVCCIHVGNGIDQWARLGAHGYDGLLVRVENGLTLRALKEKYEGKSFSIIIGNRRVLQKAGLVKHSCIVCERRCSQRASSPFGGAARSHARAAHERRRKDSVRSRVLWRLAWHAINGELASRL